ncbi:MAG: L-histidine N(alpha)-methyltransferase [Spirochaetaceae bacterium]|nr:L-histidine N(alpha)-methyltransferase [Spirochaetaceae bacterium]|tara:strand:+ start:6659 stop:7744 length:1086 start_codon:yes stop_codon:yes gene_type:complete
MSSADFQNPYLHNPAAGLSAGAGHADSDVQTLDSSIQELMDHSNDLPGPQIFFRDVVRGLEERPRTLPSRYFYDDRGSQLFQKITELPEYYPASCEREILSTKAMEISELLGEDFGLIELGPGDGHKSYHILRALAGRDAGFRYYPVDISRGIMPPLQKNLEGLVSFHGLVGDYEAGLQYLSGREDRHVVFFLGSSIGNFSIEQSADFLRRIRMSLHEGDLLLIGFDMVKDPDILIPAYSDGSGVTRDFNLNLLHRMNRELNGNLEPENFIHHAAFNPRNHAMESFLISRCCQKIKIQDPVSLVSMEAELQAFEAIQTETSQKYTFDDINELADRSGFRILKDFQDSRAYFTDSLWIADAL